MRRHTPAARWFIPTLLVTSALAMATTARAETGEAATDRLNDIIVTAQKVEQLLGTVPASVAVIGEAELRSPNLAGMERLEGRIPGLAFQPFGQAGLNSPVMRGVTANFNAFSTSTLLLVDGVPTLTAQGFENGFLDLDRIEVLRGPQSTLYGRNAEAGVIAVYNRPMEGPLRASVTGEYGSRNRRYGAASISAPIVDNTLYASASGSWFAQDGFIRNTASGQRGDDRERQNLNLGLHWTPSASTDLVLRYALQNYDDGATLWGAPTAPRLQVGSGLPSWNRSRSQTASLTAKHQITPDITIQSITAYNVFRDDVQQDTDFQPADMLSIRRDHHLRALSEEVRIDGKLGAATWLVGLYGDWSDNDLHNASRRGIVVEDLQTAQKSDSLAAFTHWTIPLGAGWTASLGARVERTGVEIRPLGGVRQKRDWTYASPRAALQHGFAPGQLWYASVSRGVRTGGFNALSPAAGYPAFAPEKIWSYETGIKGSIDGRLRYAVTGYWMDIKDMQVIQMPSPGTIYITSAATATSKGVEAELDWAIGAGFALKGGLTWNRTRFDRFVDGGAVYDGKRNPFAPDLNGHVTLRYDSPTGLFAEGGLTGSSRVHLDAANRYRRGGYRLVDATAGYRRGPWEVVAYVRNLFNERYDAVGYQNGFVTVYSPPREGGVRLNWRM